MINTAMDSMYVYKLAIHCYVATRFDVYKNYVQECGLWEQWDAPIWKLIHSPIYM